MMKRFMTLLLAVIMVFTALPVTGFAAENKTQFECVQNADKTYTLKITGTGAMEEYDTAAPWDAQAASITKIEIGEGVTAVSTGAFDSLTALKEVDVASTVTAIAENAFAKDTAFTMNGWINHASGVYAGGNDKVTLKLKELRILTIGNSHTDDYSCYFGTMFEDLANSMNTVLKHESVLYGGRRLIVDEGSTRSHYLASKDASIPGHQDYKNAFAKRWDLVLMQDYRESVQFGADFADEMQAAVRWIKEECPGAQIGWVADWAEPESGYLYKTGIKAMKAVEALDKDKPDFIIPLTTIFENARTSYFGTTMNPKGVSSHATYAEKYPILERDEKHLSLELGRYLAGAGVLYHVFENLRDNLSLHNGFDFFANLKTAPVFNDWAGEFVDDYRVIVKEAAVNSYKKPLVITKSQYTEDPFVGKFASMTELLKKELPWAVVKERLGGTVVTEELVKKINDATGFGVKLQDVKFVADNGKYTITVDCHYGYTFAAEAALNGVFKGIVDGYYYKNGEKAYGGLMYIDSDGDGVQDSYVYAKKTGELVSGTDYLVVKTNGLLKADKYTFDQNGKMTTSNPEVPELKNGIHKNKDGKLYFYDDAMKVHAGLIYLDSDGDGKNDTYYYASATGEIVCGKDYHVSKTNGLLPVGVYTFGPDGKLVK